MIYNKGALKVCTGCGEELPRNSDYFKPRGDKGYLSPRCHDCLKRYNRIAKRRSRREIANRPKDTCNPEDL